MEEVVIMFFIVHLENTSKKKNNKRVSSLPYFVYNKKNDRGKEFMRW